jgi:cytochrome c oxidase assembly factor CtaG
MSRRIPQLSLLAAWAAATAWPWQAAAHVLSADATGVPDLGPVLEPWVLGPLLLSLVLYLAGDARLRYRQRHGPTRRIAGDTARGRQLLAFLGGWITLAIALVSPLDPLGGVLFSAHMVQHELLMIVAAPLLVMGRPLAVWLWAFPDGARRPLAHALRARPWLTLWRLLTLPLSAWLLHAAALWIWHAPRFFQAALADPVVHGWQHASFLGSALLFWWPIFGMPQRAQAGGPAMLSLFTTMVHTGALGALLTLAPGLWYPAYIEPCSALGIDPLHDQQLGGLIMWVPGGLAYLVGGLAVGWRWLTRTPIPACGDAAPAAQHGERI